MTWTSAGSAVGSWDSSSQATTRAWRRLSIVTDSAGDVDFNLAIDDQYPWPVLDHSPQTVLDDPQEVP